MGRRPAGLRRGHDLRLLRRPSRHRLGQRLPDPGLHHPRGRRVLRHHQPAGGAAGGDDGPGRVPSRPAGARRPHQAPEAAHLHLHPPVGGHVPPHVHALAHGAQRRHLPHPPGPLPAVHRRRVGAQRRPRHRRPPRLPRPAGSGGQLDPGAPHRPPRPGGDGRPAGGRGLRRGHVLPRLPVPVGGHHVHPGRGAPLRLPRPHVRAPAGALRPPLRRLGSHRRLRPGPGLEPLDLPARGLVLHRLRLPLPGGGGRRVLAAQHPLGRLRLDRRRGGAVDLVLRPRLAEPGPCPGRAASCPWP